MHTMLQDLRFGLRMLLKRPVVTAVAALSLGFGIAAHTATFAVASGFLYAPLPWHDTERVVLLTERLRQNPDPDSIEALSPAALLRYREGVSALASIEGSSETTANITGDGDPERIKVVDSSVGLLDGIQCDGSAARLVASQIVGAPGQDACEPR